VKFSDFALQGGLRAAWSTPIMSRDGKVLGTFCMYYHEARQPGPGDIWLIDYAGRLAGIAIERDRSQTAIEKSEAQLRHIVDAAVKLGLPTRTLDSKIKRLGINKFRFKV
jgi:GAF domain-containing protein